jgi:hypothetical protein
MDEQNVGRKLEAVLRNLVGKTVMYNTTNYVVRDWRVKDGVVTIVAEPRWIELVETTAYAKIRNEFLPVADDSPKFELSILPKNGAATDLKKILLENITKVQSDPKYVEQANAINKSATAIINLARLEVEFFKLKKRE